MVEGHIYMDTGTEIPDVTESIEIFGIIVSSVSGTEKPAKNGESNFGCEGSEYAYYDDAIIVRTA